MKTGLLLHLAPAIRTQAVTLLVVPLAEPQSAAVPVPGQRMRMFSVLWINRAARPVAATLFSLS